MTTGAMDSSYFFRLICRLPGILGRIRVLPKADADRPFETITFRLDNAADVTLHQDRITIHLSYEQGKQDEHHHYHRRIERHPIISAYYGLCPAVELHYSARPPICLIKQTA